MPVYQGAKLKEISFPLGGVGSGSVGLGGNGRLLDWEIFNRPNKGSLNGYTHMAVKAIKDGRIVDARVLMGDLDSDFSGHPGGGFGYGAPNRTMAGFPHFDSCVFRGEYPVARLSFSHQRFPGDVSLTAFNPVIPLNEDDSSIPAAFFEVSFANTSPDTLDYAVSFALANPFSPSKNTAIACGDVSGVFLAKSGGNENMSLVTDAPGAKAQLYWYRGGWQDGIATYWREFSTQTDLRLREYETDGGNDHCALTAKITLAPGASGSVRFVMSWSIPDNFNYWSPLKDEDGKDVTWKNWYATKWQTSKESALYGITGWQRLYGETLKFKNALFSATLDPAVIDAAASTLSVLKTATALRLEDGSFYGWEGCGERSGSCEGTCTHVWTYAYALCFLFPRLERSLRENEYKYCQFEDGHISFRMTLPPGRGLGWNMPCLDGQMGGVIKTYRDWKLSGDTEWLRGIFPAVQKALEFAWDQDSFVRWDKDKDGVLEGRQHHTLDVELFGPSAWLQGMYLAALKAAAEMAKALGMDDKADEYMSVFEKGKKWTDENLFNGRYYIQKVDLADKALIDSFDAGSYWNDEAGEIKYQIGDGCEIDQMLGQWHADINGLGDIFDPDHRKTALKTMFSANYKPSMREFANPWRLFSMNDDSGAVICDYPDGARKPWIPIPYCEETMHGFEYALAGLMISEGLINEGLTIVRSVRARYDGEKRNPYNEIECGSNYARSMASFALIPIFSGFEFDLPNGTLGFKPLVGGNFKAPWFTGAAWGEFSCDGDVSVTVSGGEIELAKLILPKGGAAEVLIDGKAAEFKIDGGAVVFTSPVTVKESIVVRW